MPVTKHYKFGGLDLRSKDINQYPDKASDLLNVELDGRGELGKRKGFESVATVDNSLALYNYRFKEELLSVGPTELRRRNGASFDSIPYAGAAPANNWLSAPDFAEYSGIVYWTDTDGRNELHKYDGLYTYRAGCPAPSVFGVPASVTSGDLRYVRLWLTIKDLQGNETQGEYIQLGPFDLSAIDQIDFSIETFVDAKFDGFPTKSFEPLNANQTVGGGNDTINIQSGQNNYVVGDYIYCYTQNNGVIPIEITAITATTIVVDTTPLDDEGITYNFGRVFAIGGLPGLQQIVRYSGLVTIKYGISDFLQGPYYVNDLGTLQSHKGAFYNIDIPLVRTGGQIAGTSPTMEETYDTLIVKGLPPIARYINLYNNVLVLGSVNVDDQEISSAQALSVADTIYYSDLSVGSTVETFAPFDREQIGGTNEGGITGLFSNQDTLTVFKERQVYHIQGVLTGGNFRVRNGLTAEIGCVSHRSLYEYRGGCIFMSNRGVYYTKNGSDPLELSDPIEPLFTDDPSVLDLTGSITVLDQFREKFYMFIPGNDPEDSIVLMYDYYWKEWFKHDGFNADGGFVIKDDILIHTTEDAAADLFSRIDDPTDGGVAFRAFWASSWQTIGEPGLFKRFLNILLWNRLTAPFNMKLRVQKDWNTDHDIQESDKQFEDKDLKVDLKAHDAKAMRFLLEGTIANEPLNLSGFELEYEMISTRHKG